MPTGERLVGACLALALLAQESPKRAALLRETILAARSGDPTSTEAATDRLVRAGPALIPALFEALDSGLLPPPSPDPRLEPRAEPETLDAKDEEILVAALRRFRRSELLGPIARTLEGTQRPDARLDCLELLGAVGEGRDFSLLCQAIRRADPEEDPDPDLARAFRGSVCAILRRDVTAFPAVRALLHSESAAIRYRLVGALADTQSPSALEILSAALGAHPEEDAELLTEIARMAASIDLPVDGRVPPSLRLYLHGDDPNLARAAALALGRMEDSDSIPDLVDLLRHPDKDLARAAHEALQSIAGADLLPDPERWRGWLRSEAAWFAQVAPRPDPIEDIEAEVLAEGLLDDL